MEPQSDRDQHDPAAEPPDHSVRNAIHVLVFEPAPVGPPFCTRNCPGLSADDRAGDRGVADAQHVRQLQQADPASWAASIRLVVAAALREAAPG
jgi:hypothetical protein